MNRTILIGLAALSLVVALAAWAQERAVTDFNVWLRQQRQASAPDGAATRQAIHDRIVAARASRGKVVALARNGRWRSERSGRVSAADDQPDHGWFVQLQHNTDDGTISGHLGVVGSGLFSDGIISGHVDGRSVTGVVTDDSGAQLATFTGTVSRSGMIGTYLTTDGDSGSWSYDDPAAQPHVDTVATTEGATDAPLAAANSLTADAVPLSDVGEDSNTE
jgi:hypothetical protein